jgi:LDH2 family malate/lactate/ureidoglycolate dehydrogenase
MGSHGIARLPVYIGAIEKRIFNPTPKFQKLTESASMALLDGDNSLGQVIGTKAMKLAVEKAKDTGVGIVGAKNVGHLGRLAFIAQVALEHHCVGGIMGNTQPMMAPWGGASKKIGNNPFAIAVPRGSEGSVILDMSCSVVSKGRIRQAAFQKEVIPKDWALDEDGVPTDNPKRALEGMLLPFGRYKGYGIALMIDILAGIMTGAGFSTNLGTLYPLGDKPLRHGTLTFAFDPFVFIPKKEFTEKLDSLLQDIKSPPFAEWASKIYAPGEPEKERKAKISREGVHLTEVVYSEIEKLGQRLGISPPRPFRSENERGINGPV